MLVHAAAFGEIGIAGTVELSSLVLSFGKSRSMMEPASQIANSETDVAPLNVGCLHPTKVLSTVRKGEETAVWIDSMLNYCITIVSERERSRHVSSPARIGE